MTVVDASVLVHALVGADQAAERCRRTVAAQPTLAAPQILRAEAISALRQLERLDMLAPAPARQAVDRVRRLDTWDYPIDPFVERVWELRDNLTTYDAWYVAVAERLGLSLATLDQRLADAPGPTCSVQVVA